MFLYSIQLSCIKVNKNPWLYVINYLLKGQQCLAAPLFTPYPHPILLPEEVFSTMFSLGSHERKQKRNYHCKSPEILLEWRRGIFSKPSFPTHPWHSLVPENPGCLKKPPLYQCFARLITNCGHFHIIQKWHTSSIFVFCPFSCEKKSHKLRNMY